MIELAGFANVLVSFIFVKETFFMSGNAPKKWILPYYSAEVILFLDSCLQYRTLTSSRIDHIIHIPGHNFVT